MASTATLQRRRELLRERDGNHCWWCDVEFTDELPPTIDHLIPRSQGGIHTVDNCVLACEPCNNARGHIRHCDACGHRVVRWHAATWVERRHCFHHQCIHRIINALIGRPSALARRRALQAETSDAGER